MWWFGVSVVLTFVVIFLLISLERALQAKPHTGLSDLWLGSQDKEHLHSLSYEELHDEVSARRRDKGFDIHPGNSAQIHWYNGEKRKTKVAVVFVHGWSASPQEIFAVVEIMAKNLKANLYCARLSGHGGRTERGGGRHLLEESAPEKLFADAFDAAHIGLKLGDKIVLIGSSTGGALCTYVAAHADPELKSKISALVGVSPAYALNVPAYKQLGCVFAWLRGLLPAPVGSALSRALIRLLAGENRDITPRNDEHTLRTSLYYPSEALLTCFAVIWEAYNLDFSKLDVPTMFIGSPQDDTISWNHTCGAAVFGKLPGPKAIHCVKPNDTDHQHVLGSHFMSPNYIQEIQKAMTSFVAHHCFLDEVGDEEE